MPNIEPTETLAYSIGRDRIATVVDEFYDQIQTHPALAAPFGEVGDWIEHKEQLTYFWWITLGGAKVGGAKERAVTFDVVGKHWKAGFNVLLLQDWVALFRQVVSSIVDRDLAEAWIEKVALLGRALLMANDRYTAKLNAAVG